MAGGQVRSLSEPSGLSTVSALFIKPGSASSSASGPTALSATSNPIRAAQVLELWLPSSSESAPNVASPFRRSSVLIGIRNKKRTNKKIIKLK